MKGFPENSRVCFVGDSITYNNGFISHISAFYHEHFKERNVNFYNCGVAGGRISTALPILDEDVLSYRPTHAVIMFGINDSERCWLDLPKSMERYEKMVSAYEVYKKNLAEICRRLRENDVEIILCTQIPYDEYQNSEVAPLKGGYALMAGYAEYVRQFAKENGYGLCDYHRNFSRAIQKEDLINPDRVHPNDRGQFLIAKCFLEFQGIDIGEQKTFPKYMDKWRELVNAYRKIWTVERLVIDKYDLPQEKRLAIVKEYIKENENNKNTEFIVSLAKDYVNTKHMQKEINEEIITQMEIEFKK
ncbi:MAG: SGNH/GDSL hydrolase family protein [Clostridia bacterium]|nr:SGNH/GDSL hydrolase family protein [Clostridia bacterium]